MGWEPVAFSEIEPFPCAVLKHHYPNVPNWGDMTNYKNWSDANIDLLVGGTPCQSFSIAGLRKGLDDPRGNLMLTYLAIAERYRPKWLVWENVPGVLSSNEGRDFGTFLTALGQLRYGYSYRVLDAQYFGVAQRRRRVFVVGHLGSWQRAAAVLLERSCLSGHPAPSREKGQGTAADAQASVGADRPILMRQREGKDGGGKGPLISEEKSLTLATSNDQVLSTAMQVRRLTPVECERLQGFPDNFTRIPWKKKPAQECPDGPRYKALGNSMAVPCMRWIGERIDQVNKIP
jgi:DNA (cytosine-5)-methyltransferase 1